MRLTSVAGLVCGFLLFGAAEAQTKRPMTFADLQAMKRVGDPQVSPSGKWVLFSVTEVSLEKNSKVNHLWVVALGGAGTKAGPSPSAQDDKSKERQVTAGGGESGGRFSPDGKWVMYSSSETGSGQIWVAPWDEAAGTMGSGHEVTALETEADGAVWAPDSVHFLFVSDVYPECESKAAMGSVRNEEEAGCNSLRDSIESKNPVKARVFTELLYRHWDHYQGLKRSHIFYGSMMPGAGAPVDLTPASVVGDHVAPTFSLGGPVGYAVSPDGKEIAYEVNLDKVPAESTNNDIFVLQVGAEPGTAKKVSTSPGSDDGPAYSPDGKWLAWRSQARNGYESDKFDLVVMDRATGKIKNLTTKFDGWVDELTWAPDSKSVYVVTPERGMELAYRLAIHENEVAELTYTCPSTYNSCSHAELSSIQPLPDGKGLVMAHMSVDTPSEIAIANFVQNDPSKPWYQNPCRGCWGELTVEKGDSQKLWDIYKDANPLLAEFVPLTHMNDSQLAVLEISPMEHFWFAGANGTKVEGFIVRPPNFDASTKYPVKFLIHGGPQGAWGDAWSYRWNPELFAADGYVVVMVNPRGSTGYGQKFLEQVSGDWGGRPYVDLMKGMDAAEQKYGFIDKDRECALGASYGGFMADWVLTHTNRFKCIVTHDGMYNPQSAFGTTEESWFNEWEFRPLEAGGRVQGTRNRKGGVVAGLDAGLSTPPSQKRDDSGRDDKSVGVRVGANADSSAALRNDKQKSNGKNPEFGAGEAVVEQSKPAYPWDFYDKPVSEDPFRKWSPMLSIKNAKTPTLVIHGQRDYRLDVSEGLQLFNALQMLHVPSKMVYFENEGHWVLKPKDSEFWYSQVNDWCDQWVHAGRYAGMQGDGR